LEEETVDMDNASDVDSGNMIEKAKGLVPNFDKKLKEMMASGKYLTESEAINSIIRQHSREKIGEQWLDGFWIAYEKSKKGKQMAYVLDKDNELKTVFFIKSIKDAPKRFDPVKVKVNIIKNLLSQNESLEFVKHKPGHLKRADMMEMLSAPGSVLDQKMYLIAGKIRYVNQVTWDKNQKLKVPKPLFDRSPDGKLSCNIRLAIADFANENTLCNVGIYNIKHLANIFGRKTLEIIDNFKRVPNEDKKVEKLRDALINTPEGSVIILGFGSNQKPDGTPQAKGSHISPGDTGFITNYHKVFKGVKQKMSQDVDNIEKELEEAEEEKKVPIIALPIDVRKHIKQMIKGKEATKKSLRLYGKKVKVQKEAIALYISKLIDEGKAVVKGEKILPK
jgi:hypothetical protein